MGEKSGQKKSLKKRERSSYSKAFKHKVCQEYLTTHQSQKSLVRKYGIKSCGTIFYWLRHLSYHDPSLGPIKKESIKLEPEVPDIGPSMTWQVKELEKKLADANL